MVALPAIDYDRPASWPACRPDGNCHRISCRHHPLSEVTPNGTLKLRTGRRGQPPSLAPQRPTSERRLDDLATNVAEHEGPTCALGVVRDGEPMTFEQIGAVMCVTRERVRQIEQEALAKLRRNGGLRVLYEAVRRMRDVPDSPLGSIADAVSEDEQAREAKRRQRVRDRRRATGMTTTKGGRENG